MPSATFGALSGIRVLDLTQLLAGAFCSQLLADHGAEVIKVEPPTGDQARAFGPFLPDDTSRFFGPLFQSANRNKRGVVLDLKKDEGRRVFLRMVESADCLIENFRPGAMDRLGLGYEQLSELNPRLVYTSVSGFGDRRGGSSPYQDWPSLDVVAQAMGGIMSITGPDASDPTKVGGAHGDFVPGLFAGFGTLAALWEARQSGRGQFVDVAMVDSVLALCELIPAAYSYAHRIPRPSGSRLPPVAPFGRLRARDGFVVVGATTQKQWRDLCELLGAPALAEDPRFVSAADRVTHQDELYPELERITAQKTKAELTELLGGKIPFGPVYDAGDIFSDPHFENRDMLPMLEHPGSKQTAAVLGIPVKLSRTPGEVRDRAPLLGEHTDEVLASYGFTAVEISELRTIGAIS